MGDLFGKYRLDALSMVHWDYLFVRWAFIVISIQINLALHRKEEFSLAEEWSELMVMVMGALFFLWSGCLGTSFAAKFGADK